MITNPLTSHPFLQARNWGGGGEGPNRLWVSYVLTLIL
jgi:hypothetical protein